MYDIIVKLLPLMGAVQGHLLGSAAAPSYIELFLDTVKTLNQGSTDTSKDKRVVHPHLEKVQVLAGIFADLDVVASMYILVDVWEKSYRSFHKLVRSPSRYGGFDQPNLCHMMAEQAIKDTLYYRKARVNPEAHLPRLYAWMETPRVRAFVDALTSEKRARFKKMAACFLEAAEGKHLTWNGKTWTRARHLLGILCLEERRHWCTGATGESSPCLCRPSE